jgi:PAS domain-containing protein
MRDALRSGVPIDIQYRIRDIDGVWTWMRSRGAPRFGPTGEIVRWYGTVEHIGEPIPPKEEPTVN